MKFSESHYFLLMFSLMLRKKKLQPNSELSLNFAEDPTPDPTSVVRNPRKSDHGERHSRLPLSSRLFCLSLCWHILWQIPPFHRSSEDKFHAECLLPLSPPPSQCWPFQEIFQDSPLLLQQKKNHQECLPSSLCWHILQQIPPFHHTSVDKFHMKCHLPLSLSHHLCFCADTF